MPPPFDNVLPLYNGGVWFGHGVCSYHGYYMCPESSVHET